MFIICVGPTNGCRIPASYCQRKPQFRISVMTEALRGHPQFLGLFWKVTPRDLIESYESLGERVAPEQ
jgi:hypothetical protein